MRALLTDVGFTRITSDVLSISTATTTSTTSFAGDGTIRWAPLELLDPERCGLKKNSGPTKKSDMYSMAMTIYEVNTLRYKSGWSTDVIAGSYGQDPVSRVHGPHGNTRNHSRCATEGTSFRYHAWLHAGTVGYGDNLLES